MTAPRITSMTALHPHLADVTAAEVPAARFRHAMGHFATGVTVVTSVGADGAPVVNVLAATQRHLSVNFARRGLAAAWHEVGHRPGRTGSPRLDGVLAAL